MSTLTIQYHLYRSNPAILRCAAVPENFPLKELPELCCILFGLESSDCYCQFSNEHISGSDTTSEEISICPGMNGSLLLAKDTAAAKLLPLTVYFDIYSGEDENISFPMLKDWLGFQLPSELFPVSVINEMQAAFQESGSFQASAGNVLYRDAQLLSAKRVTNAICRRYAPDQAHGEIRSALGIPIQELLNDVNLPYLKAKLSSMSFYSLYGGKKSDYVSALTEKLEEADLRKIFGKMEMQEYRNFRTMALSGNTSCTDNNDLAQEFPVLFSEFMIRFIKKQGLRIARGLLQDYETWFDSDDEKQFRVSKMIRTAMHWCGFHYGIFSIEHCWQVLQTVYPKEITREDLVAYWGKRSLYADPENISFTGTYPRKNPETDFAYDNRLFSYSSVDLYYQAVRNDESPRKLPEDSESFEKAAAKSLCVIAADDPRVAELRSAYDYYYYDRDDIAEILNKGIQKLRLGISPAQAVIEITRHSYWGYRSEEIQSGLTRFLQEEWPRIPQFLFYGFTRDEALERHLISRIDENVKALLKTKDNKKKTGKGRR